MFRVRSSFKGKIEGKRAFAGREEILFEPYQFHRDARRGRSHSSRSRRQLRVGPSRLKLRWATVRFTFPVRETSPHAEVIEWSPAPNERENLLRYS
jgi:hypothetical protein